MPRVAQREAGVVEADVPRGLGASAWAGVGSVLLLVPALFVAVLAGDQPAPDATTTRILDYLNHHRDLYLSSLLFEIVSMALLLWFLVGLAGFLTAGALALELWVLEAAVVVLLVSRRSPRP